jgi:hypothetical protein
MGVTGESGMRVRYDIPGVRWGLIPSMLMFVFER